MPLKSRKPCGICRIRISTSIRKIPTRMPEKSGSARPTTPCSVNGAWSSWTVRHPGFAAIVGAAPDPETAKMIVEDYQKRSLYIFLAANHNGTTVAQQLLEAKVQIGWNTRIVPFGPDISSAIFALGFANRAAMAFGGVQPGDYKRMLLYNKDRIFAFVNALGEVGTEWAAAAAGCVNWGFPTLADTDIPEVLPTGVCTYEHVVANVRHEEMCQRSVEVRGLKVTVSEIDIPLRLRPGL